MAKLNQKSAVKTGRKEGQIRVGTVIRGLRAVRKSGKRYMAPVQLLATVKTLVAKAA